MSATTHNGSGAVTAIAPVTNDGERIIAFEEPYIAHIRVEGDAAFLFHRWSNEAVAEKAKAKKGSAAKKSDDVESYVYRNQDDELCIPGEYFRMAIIGAAKFRQDPRSPRKSAMDLYKAGVIALTELRPLGAKDWDYLDRRRVKVQMSAITRERPAMHAGWAAELDILVNAPEYIDPGDLHDVLSHAGRLIGVGDFRPTFGRFHITGFEVGLS